MTGTVTHLLHDFRSGSDEAAADLFRYFLPRMCKQLSWVSSCLRVHDEEDIAVTAFYKFCEAVKESRFDEISDRTELWHVLSIIAVRQAADTRRFENAKMRQSENGTVSISLLRTPLASVDNRPDLQIELLEQCEHFLSSLNDDQMRLVAEKKLEGYTNQEIANQLGISKRTTQYIICRLKEKMQKIISDRAA